MAGSAIAKDVEFVTTEEVADYIAELLRDNMPGGIYIETGDSPNEVFIISQGEKTAGIFSLLVRSAELQVTESE